MRPVALPCLPTLVLHYITCPALRERMYNRAEIIANLGLIAEVYTEHGTDQVAAVIPRMEDPNNNNNNNNNKNKPRIELYLRDLYIQMRNSRRMIYPVFCVCFRRKPVMVASTSCEVGIMNAEGTDRNEVCSVCFMTSSKSRLTPAMWWLWSC